MNNSHFCYWCGAPANSREHIPPRCFFPNKITQEGMIKKQEYSHLLTVPSCEEHNNRKSKGDEYLLAHIAPFAPDNLCAQALFQGNILRAVRRNKDLLKPTRFDGTAIYFDCNDNMIGFEIEGIARALYFIDNKSLFIGKCYIYNEKYSINSKLYLRNSEVAKIIMHESALWNTDIKGHYPAIFMYQFSPTDHQGCTSLILTFYESIRIYVVLADKKHQRERSCTFSEALQMGISIGINPLPFIYGNQGYNYLEVDNE